MVNNILFSKNLLAHQCRASLSLCSGKIVLHLLHQFLLLASRFPPNRLEERLQNCHSELAQLSREGGEPLPDNMSTHSLHDTKHKGVPQSSLLTGGTLSTTTHVQ